MSGAAGGWPATCAGQLSGDWSRMWWVKSRRVAGMSWKRSMTRRYSCRVVSRPAIPRCQPSTSAREQIQAVAAPHVVQSSVRHRSRAATAGP
ncbi:hypothetical protein QFZ66_000624 [Streptomyces sp. B4I13]|nr:hypothetical protein [Streptomyces sp. B4I13]